MLLSEIQQALAASTASLNSSSSNDDLYEAYLFSLVLRAARDEGASIRLCCILGGTPDPFVFRTSPGYIGSQTQNYGYSEISFQGCPILEAHVGIRVSGQSNVLHECDVAVILQDEADVCRNGLIAPRSSKIVLAIEAKYYSVTIPLRLGREFLGLTRDLSAACAFFVMNRDGGTAEKLLAHKGQFWEHYITPSMPGEVSRFLGAIRSRFKDFKAQMG
jgi:hypothetical protein